MGHRDIMCMGPLSPVLSRHPPPPPPGVYMKPVRAAGPGDNRGNAHDFIVIPNSFHLKDFPCHDKSGNVC